MDFCGKTALVYGCGVSGIGAADLLGELGAKAVLFDENENLDREKVLGKLARPETSELVVGSLPAELFAALDLAVLSPGVPCDLPNVLRLREAGVPVIGEVELAYEAGRGEVLAITGTNGKTTTTSLVGAIMQEAGRNTFVVGNIGNAYTGAALKTKEGSVVVAEISSFQLETIDRFHPAVSAILNITEDHLNRHHTMEEYIRVKELITKNQTAEDVCVLNYEDAELRAFGETACPASVFWFSSARELPDGMFLRGDAIVMRRGGREEELIGVNELLLIGIHNYENVMAAAAVAVSAGIPLSQIAKTLRTFKPVAHRIEYAGEKHGVVWYNDSKGTNPDAAIRGIRAMSRPTFLIAGGYDKGSDYREWIRSFDGRVKRLVLEGKTRFDIRDAALSCGFPGDRIVLFETMRESMEYCAANAESGDAVLLSPACASWGEFPNYEVRGEIFKKYVAEEV